MTEGRGSSGVELVEMTLGPGLPALRIGSGPKTLVVLPGLSIHPGNPIGFERRQALSGWDSLLPDYTIHRLTRRVRPVGTTFAEMAEDAIAAIEEVGPPVDLIGASTGGILAIHVAGARPDLIRRLVLVITAARDSDFGIALLDRMIGAVEARQWRAAYAAGLPIGAASRPARAALAAFGWLLGPRLMGFPRDPTLLLAELVAERHVDARPLLSLIDCPALVIGGEHDPVYTPDLVREVAAGMPDGTAVIVPKLAHMWPTRLTVDFIAPFLAAPRAPT